MSADAGREKLGRATTASGAVLAGRDWREGSSGRLEVLALERRRAREGVGAASTTGADVRRGGVDGRSVMARDAIHIMTEMAVRRRRRWW